MLAESRSAPLQPCVHPDDEHTQEIHAALDAIEGDIPVHDTKADWARPPFDFETYRDHLRSLTEGCVVDFDGISPLIADRRLDRVFRFITAVLMDHEGALDMQQSQSRSSIVLVGT